MRAKEQICKDQTNTRPMPMKDIYEAMESFAKETTIAFTEWANQNYGYVEYNKWEGFDDETYTTDQIFALFIEHQQTKP